MEDALTRAKHAAGGTSGLARKIGIRPQAVSQWRHVPPNRVLAVEAATGGSVSRHELRPDLYPPLPVNDNVAAIDTVNNIEDGRALQAAPRESAS